MIRYDLMIPERDRAEVVVSEVPFAKGETVLVDGWTYRIDRIEHVFKLSQEGRFPYYVNQHIRLFLEKL